MFSPVYFNVFEFNTDSPAVRAKIINFNRANKKTTFKKNNQRDYLSAVENFSLKLMFK